MISVIGVAAWFISGDSAGRDVSNDSRALSEVSTETRRVLPDEPAKLNTRPLAPVPPNEGAIGPQRLQSIARHTYLNLLDSKTLTFNQAVLDLLDVNSSQIEELNGVLKRFLTSLQSEELAHAHVATTSDGGEEIVVGAFDRVKLISKLRDDIARILGKDAGDFVAGRTYYDTDLAVGNSELRLSIERGNDGFDRLVVDQHIRAPDALDSETPILRGEVTFAPTTHEVVKRLLGKGVDPRFSHLFSAVDRLPRRK